MKLTGTNAILRHIARKHNLCGNTVEERARVDMAAEQVMDMRWVNVLRLFQINSRNAAVGLFYNPAFASIKGAYLEKLATTLASLEAFLGERPWLCGQTISFPDFHLYEMLDQHLLLAPNCLASCPKLRSLHRRFQELPAIDAYMKSEEFMAAPINNLQAAWGDK